MIRIAIYGKGGIGKSTTAANLSAALAQRLLRVMQIGCDPKSDSTILLTDGKQIPTVLELLRRGEAVTLEELVHTGSFGVLCVEAGGPTPGSGCAGRGIITAFETLKQFGAYEVYRPDVVLYDVLGDVVCGGFSMPLRSQYTDLVLVVTSGERMSLHAAKNILTAVQGFSARGYARAGGIILNRRNVPGEQDLVRQLAGEYGLPLLADLPRAEAVAAAEAMGRTVLECFPETEIARSYRALGETLLEVCGHGA